MKILGDPELQDAVRKLIQAQFGEALKKPEAVDAKAPGPGAALDDAF